jgi:hypothetical protein
MNRLLLVLGLILLALVGAGVLRFVSKLGMLGPPRPASAEFRLAAVNGTPVGPRMCEGGIRGARMVLGKNGRWWIKEQVCAPAPGSAVWIGTYLWSGDTLTLHRIGARRGERPMARVVLRGDTLDLVNTSIGSIHSYRYVLVRRAPR